MRSKRPRRPAPLQPQEWARVPEVRCERCGKTAFAGKRDARTAVNRIGKYRRMRAYYDGRCGWWHLTTEDKRDE